MKTQWQDGYVCDVPYTSSFHFEITPSYINFTLLLNGFETPDLSDDFTYCELGCGFGANLMVLAALYPKAQFYGVDFNAQQMHVAQNIAKKSDLNNLHFIECSFEDAVHNEAWFPKFDYIVFHGIYSWGNRDNQKHLITFCKQMLKTAGVVYNSYNALPGWSQFVPIQRALKEISNLYPDASDKRMLKSFEVLHAFSKTGAKSLGEGVQKWIERNMKRDPHYLVHEYLSDQWEAFYFLDVQKDMSEAKLSYAAQVSPTEAFENLSIPKNALEVLKEEFPPTHSLHEQMKDYWINRTFRKDLYVKGFSKLNPDIRSSEIEKLQFMLITPIEEVKDELDFALGTTTIHKDLFTFLTGELKKGAFSIHHHKQHSLHSQLLAISLLVQNKFVVPLVQNYKPDYKRVAKLNNVICQDAIYDNRFQFAVGSHMQTAMSISNFNQVILLHVNQKKVSIEKLATNIQEYLNQRNITVLPEDETELSQLEFIQKKCKEWNDKTLPYWKILGIYR